MSEDDLAKANNDGDILLHIPVKEGLLEIAKELILNMNENDLAKVNSDDCTPLDLLVEKGNTEIAELLKSKLNKQSGINE